MHDVPVSEDNFDLVIRMGELGARFSVEQESVPGRRVTIPPFTMLKDEELLSRDAARNALGLSRHGRYALFSLGPGNLKDISGIGNGLITEITRRGFTAVWTRPPISVRDVPLPANVMPITVFPLVRVMRAFDVFIAAAGYNTCAEVLQARVPTLFVPNTQVNDDQIRRAEKLAEVIPAVVSPCETAEQRADAINRLVSVSGSEWTATTQFDLCGAEYAADEILRLIKSTSTDQG
jgi:hypothetical protein